MVQTLSHQQEGANIALFGASEDTRRTNPAENNYLHGLKKQTLAELNMFFVARVETSDAEKKACVAAFLKERSVVSELKSEFDATKKEGLTIQNRNQRCDTRDAEPERDQDEELRNLRDSKQDWQHDLPHDVDRYLSALKAQALVELTLYFLAKADMDDRTEKNIEALLAEFFRQKRLSSDLKSEFEATKNATYFCEDKTPWDARDPLKGIALGATVLDEISTKFELDQQVSEEGAEEEVKTESAMDHEDASGGIALGAIALGTTLAGATALGANVLVAKATEVEVTGFESEETAEEKCDEGCGDEPIVEQDKSPREVALEEEVVKEPDGNSPESALLEKIQDDEKTEEAPVAADPRSALLGAIKSGKSSDEIAEEAVALDEDAADPRAASLGGIKGNLALGEEENEADVDSRAALLGATKTAALLGAMESAPSVSDITSGEEDTAVEEIRESSPEPTFAEEIQGTEHASRGIDLAPEEEDIVDEAVKEETNELTSLENVEGVEVVLREEGVKEQIAWSFYREICGLVMTRWMYEEAFQGIQKDPLYQYLNSCLGFNDYHHDHSKYIMQKNKPWYNDMSKFAVCEDLTKDAKASKPRLADICKSIAKELKLKEVGLGPIKDKQAALEKAKLKYNDNLLRVKDFCRAFIVVPDLATLLALIEILLASNETIYRIKLSSLKKGGDALTGGYHDCKINLEIKGHICEIQVHLEAMYSIRGVGGFTHYKQYAAHSIGGFNPCNALNGLDDVDVAKLIEVGKASVENAPQGSLNPGDDCSAYFALAGLFKKQDNIDEAKRTVEKLNESRSDGSVPDLIEQACTRILKHLGLTEEEPFKTEKTSTQAWTDMNDIICPSYANDAYEASVAKEKWLEVRKMRFKDVVPTGVADEVLKEANAA